MRRHERSPPRPPPDRRASGWLAEPRVTISSAPDSDVGGARGLGHRHLAIVLVVDDEVGRSTLPATCRTSKWDAGRPTWFRPRQ